MSSLPTRRRLIGISAAAAGLALLPFGGRQAAGAHLVTHQATALGAVATIRLHHPDREAARRLVARALAEVRRLEGLFSLYRTDSALTALNGRGVLEAPPPELVRLLQECRRYAELTGGAFDPTVQPLWRLYAEHFGRPDGEASPPPPALVAETLARVGQEHLILGRDRIAFARRGMALTLNGIAQGAITDRVVELFRAEGIERTLVDLGEARALGPHPDGRPWQVGIADPDRPGAVIETLAVTDRAVATSGGYGLTFDRAQRFNHIVHPRTGASAGLYRSVTVVAPTATEADALSTAFSLMPAEAIERVLAQEGALSVHLVLADGTSSVLPAGRPRAA